MSVRHQYMLEPSRPTHCHAHPRQYAMQQTSSLAPCVKRWKALVRGVFTKKHITIQKPLCRSTSQVCFSKVWRYTSWFLYGAPSNHLPPQKYTPRRSTLFKSMQYYAFVIPVSSCWFFCLALVHAANSNKTVPLAQWSIDTMCLPCCRLTPTTAPCPPRPQAADADAKRH